MQQVTRKLWNHHYQKDKLGLLLRSHFMPHAREILIGVYFELHEDHKIRGHGAHHGDQQRQIQTEESEYREFELT
jgi:hypothetical protein